MNKLEKYIPYLRYVLFGFLGLARGKGLNYFWAGEIRKKNGIFELGRSNGFLKGYDIELSGGSLIIGDRNYFNKNVKIACLGRVEIGDHCAFGDSVHIYDHDHKFDDLTRDIRDQGYDIKPVRIGSNVWVGAKATILKGVTIGDGAVIGAGAVVTKDVPPNAIAGGIPARVLKMRG